MARGGLGFGVLGVLGVLGFWVFRVLGFGGVGFRVAVCGFGAWACETRLRMPKPGRSEGFALRRLSTSSLNHAPTDTKRLRL